MIFAAGRGTRLQPLTDTMPKALVKINGKPILGMLIERLKSFGIDEIIINVHHFPEMIADYLKENNNFEIRIEISDESDELLDTGGGLKKASWFFDDGGPFLLHNSDVITDLDYSRMMEFHNNAVATATLAVRERETSRYLLFDDKNILCGWENVKTGEKIIKRDNYNLNPFAFSGIHIIDPEIFKLMPDKKVFSMIDLYLSVCSTNKIKAFNHTDGQWFDIGTVEKLKNCEFNYFV